MWIKLLYPAGWKWGRVGDRVALLFFSNTPLWHLSPKDLWKPGTPTHPPAPLHTSLCACLRVYLIDVHTKPVVCWEFRDRTRHIHTYSTSTSTTSTSFPLSIALVLVLRYIWYTCFPPASPLHCLLMSTEVNLVLLSAIGQPLRKRSSKCFCLTLLVLSSICLSRHLSKIKKKREKKIIMSIPSCN